VSRTLLGAGLALVLGLGCSEPRTPALGDAAREYFPLVAGARWVYEVRTRMGRLEVEVTAQGPMQLPDGTAIFVMDERNLGPDLGFVETAPVGYLVTEGYVARLSGVDYDGEGGLRRLGQDEPVWILPLEPEPGHAWTQQTRLFQTPEGGGARLGWSGDVRPVTSVDVPAGHFDHVIEVQTVYRDASLEDLDPKVVYHDFYARGVGLVKSRTLDPSGDSANTVEQVLVSYEFPER